MDWNAALAETKANMDRGMLIVRAGPLLVWAHAPTKLASFFGVPFIPTQEAAAYVAAYLFLGGKILQG